MREGVKASTCPLAVLSRCRGALPPARPLAFGIPHQSPGRLGAHQDGGDDARLRATILAQDAAYVPLVQDGRLDRVVENASEPCAGALYAPFPDLEKLTR